MPRAEMRPEQRVTLAQAAFLGGYFSDYTGTLFFIRRSAARLGHRLM
jgi:hypothetical protein